MDCCGLSSTGLQNIDANELTADNITVFSNLNISGYTYINNVLIKNNATLLSSLNVDGLTTLNNTTNINGLLYVSGTNILQTVNSSTINLNSINEFINTSSSGLNITGTSNINFNVGTQLTTINVSGLSVFHGALESFPYNYAGIYNVGDRFNNLYHVMADSPDNIINFDATHNTVIRIREQDIVNQINYPRQFQIQTFQGTTISKFDVQGLQVLDKYNNWYYINKMFSMTDNSILLCSDRIKVDTNGNLNVYIPTSNSWLSVPDNLLNNNVQNITEQINTATNSIIGAVGALATLANYYQSLQLTLAVTAGVVVGSGLLLAFTLKQDRFEVKKPLNLRPAASGEYFNQLELMYNETFLIDSNNKLSVNTSGFLCPYFGDLSLATTPANITSNSSTYVVVTQLTQPITCFSSLNVSGYTSFNNDVTCMSNLTINGTLNCSSINASSTTLLTTNLNSLSTSSILSINNLNNTSTTIFNNLNSLSTSSILSINNLNSTSTTIFNNLNNLSTSSILSINNLNTTSTSIINNLNSLSTNSTLSINNLNSTSTTIFNNLNSLSTSSTLSINNLNATSTSLFNKTNFTNLFVSGASTLLSSLNIEGKTIIGTDLYNYSDSILEVNKNLILRKNVLNVGDRVEIRTGTGYGASYITMEEGFDININTPNNATSQSVINLSSNKSVNINAPKTYMSNDCVIYGSLSCINMGKKTPMFFTTNRNINIHGTTFSCYDIDLNKYTKYISLDGYNTRVFRIRTWLADGDVQNASMRVIRADIFMTDRGGLNLFALCAPLPNEYLTSTEGYLDQFLYRDTFNRIIYCSRFGVRKVYCIFEDLL